MEENINNEIKKKENEEEYDNGKYIGEFKENIRQGKGKYIWNSKDEYIGDFKNDKIEGRGIYTWENKEIYEG